MNSEIRTLQFNQGVGVAVPPNSADVANKITLTNNATTLLTALGFYLDDVRSAVIHYYIYRRTDSGFKSMSGEIRLEGQNDAVANADKWTFSEITRVERGGDSGITFSLDETDTEKSTLQAALDNMAGANHSCIMYYKVSTLIA
jgi:hypothetical protein